MEGDLVGPLRGWPVVYGGNGLGVGKSRIVLIKHGGLEVGESGLLKVVRRGLAGWG